MEFKSVMNRELRFAFYVALCVALGLIGWRFGRDCISSRFFRRSEADRVTEIARAKPWIAEVARQARGSLAVLVFKRERIVEVHAPGWPTPRQYEMTGFSGRLGPKLGAMPV